MCVCAIDSEIGEMLNYAKIEWHLVHRYVYALMRYEFKGVERGRRQRKIEKKYITQSIEKEKRKEAKVEEKKNIPSNNI